MAAHMEKYVFGNAKHAHEHRCIVLARCRNNCRGTEATTKRHDKALMSSLAPGKDVACGLQPHSTVSDKGRSRAGQRACAHMTAMIGPINDNNNGSVGTLNDSNDANMDIYIVGLRTLQKG